MEWYIAYLLLGTFVGFFAGLFGIGGGLVLVPVLSFLFDAQHLTAQHNLHLALGTSMASILFTATSSARAHHRHGAVNMHIVRSITPGLLLGTALGALIASRVAPFYLTIFFASFVFFAGAQMLLNLKPLATRQLPGRLGMTLVGTGIGAISSLVSVGGGVMSVPFMLRHNITLRNAIGTSAALGLPIAIGGTIGYVVTGLALTELPQYSLGFVYLPALLLLAVGTSFTTHLGATAAHRLPLKWLRRGFALLLFALATKMLWKVLG
jgi:uncharacterized membrane protein YfcA